MKIKLCGEFILVNEELLREKASRPYDPRRVFYQAILDTRTYEDYFDLVRGTQVTVETFKTGPINGRMEILYARRNGWIADSR
jgi:hypothetical protein